MLPLKCSSLNAYTVTKLEGAYHLSYYFVSETSTPGTEHGSLTHTEKTLKMLML